MIDYETTKAPGVYVEETATAGPIIGAGTSTAALIGTVSKAPDKNGLGVPVQVTNWTQYTDAFGDYTAGLNLPYAVRGFFQNGGTMAYVVPIKDATGLPAALDRLTRVPEVSLVCAPSLTDSASQNLVIQHCADLGDRFAVIDGFADGAPLKADGPLQKQRGDLKTDAAAYGGLYWPWIRIPDPLARPDQPALIEVPPSGHIAGVMARSDNRVGVHKAPANETVRGCVDVAYALNDAEHGALNHNHVNAIRAFPGGPPLVWGARTLSEDTAWRFVNVRRLLCFIEDSVRQGVRWAVFAPNNLTLWKGLERTVSEFLTRVWESGALFGRTAKEAFYVKIDEELNPPAARQAGQVFVEIGVQPTGPAEFVVLRFGLWDGGASVAG
jgi:phage tail sheath protein FI